MTGFIFGGNTGTDYESLQRKRKIADQMRASSISGTPRNVGEGLTAIGQAIAGVVMDKRLKGKEAAARQEGIDSISSIMGGYGQTAAPTAPPLSESDVIANDAMTAMGKPPVHEGGDWSTVQKNIFAGESGGDYDALYGYQNRDGGKFAGTKLSSMTVDQALQFSDPSGPYGQYVKGEVGRVATPMGAYQVVGKTLQGAKAALGLSGNETMTPELQDKIGQWIYQTQGTGAWEGYRGGEKTAQNAPQGNMATIQALSKAMSNPYLPPEQKAVAQALLGQAMQGMDPAYKLDMQLKQEQLNAARNPAVKDDRTTNQKEYEFAKSQGFEGSLQEWITSSKKAGAVQVNLGQGEVGTIPQGYELFTDPETGARRMRPIAGGPEDTSKNDAAKKDQKSVSTNLVLDEIAIAKDLIKNESIFSPATGISGKALSSIDTTRAGKLKNRLTTIKANIGFDKLQAMRDASPTGGALGQVSEFENRLLQAVYGSLEQAQDDESLTYNLDRLENLYNRIINEGIPEDEARQMYSDIITGEKSGSDTPDDDDAFLKSLGIQ